MARSASPARERSPRKSTASPASTSPGKVKMIQLLEHNLKDIYWAKKKSITALPRLLKDVESEELSALINTYLEISRKHVNAYASMFHSLEIALKGKKCYGIEGLWRETDSMVQAFDQPMRDPAILEGLKKIIQYKITAYTSMSALATSLDHLRPARVMKDMLKDESEILKSLEETTDLHVKRAYLWQVDFD